MLKSGPAAYVGSNATESAARASYVVRPPTADTGEEMDNLLVVGTVSLATPLIAALVVALTSALEPRKPASLSRRERSEQD